ncbi:DUF814 domain-containing protein [Candidatus Woesearchaeota archaeon]|nr:MAG: DUF814 domain-containing protein [Candidatus Woesearchaeota archaeon]
MLIKSTSLLGSMRITLDLTKTLEENAQRFFEAAKKARKKAKGAEKTIAEWEQKLATEETTQGPAPKRVRRKKAWYEKFRWCFASDGTLLVGGRDASSNEALIKKHAEKGDLVFHTDMAGSPFVLVKGKQPTAEALREAAQFCASFGRAWKNGLASLEVFHVAPEQVTKEANTGEFLGKGAFVIRGKTTYYKARIAVAVGLDREGRVMSGPPAAVSAHCERVVEVFQGNQKTSDVAKELQRRLGGGEIDDFVAALPAGGCKLK